MNKQLSQKDSASKFLKEDTSNDKNESFELPNNQKEKMADEQSVTHQKKSVKDSYNKQKIVVKNYIIKMKGEEICPPRPRVTEIVWSWCGIFFSMCFIFYLDSSFREITVKHPLLFASIGASAVLVFALPESHYSQPRAVIGGHFFSALAGVTAYQFFNGDPVLAAAVAVSFAAVAMAFTNTMHPPGGATALLAVIGSDAHNLGYWFIITPCVTSPSILVILGVIINNFSKVRKYPRYWW